MKELTERESHLHGALCENLIDDESDGLTKRELERNASWQPLTIAGKSASTSQ